MKVWENVLPHRLQSTDIPSILVSSGGILEPQCKVGAGFNLSGQGLDSTRRTGIHAVAGSSQAASKQSHILMKIDWLWTAQE